MVTAILFQNQEKQINKSAELWPLLLRVFTCGTQVYMWLFSDNLLTKYSVSPRPQHFCVTPFLTHMSTYPKTIEGAETHNWQVCYDI